jgi:hypothetical protein
MRMKLGRLVASMGILALIGAMLAAPAGARGDAVAMPAARTNVRIDMHGHGVSGTTSRYRSSLQRPRSSARPSTATGSSRRTAAPASSAPVSLLGFAGIPDRGRFDPSDSTGALGATFFVTAVNTDYAVWHLDGTPALAPADLDTIEPDTDGLDLFDPKIVYDTYNSMFVLAYLAKSDAQKASFVVLVAIPDATADQTSTWCPSVIPGDQITTDAAQFADYPALGFDGDRVVVSTNQFTFPSWHGSFSYAQLLTFPKTSLYDCSQTLTETAFSGTKTQNQDGSPAFTIQPAQTVGAIATRQFMLSFEGPGRDSYLTVWRLAEVATGLKLKKATVPTGKMKPAPLGTQGGGSLTDRNTWWDTGDIRLINAFYDSDLNGLYAAHVVAKNLGPDPVTGGYLESVVRWYEVLPAGRLADSVLSRKGVIGQAETDAGWPVVATDGSGNLFVTYSRGSEPLGEFISAWAAEIVPGSTAAVSTLLVPGVAVHDSVSGFERWGDYNGINRDPADPSRIAMVNQIATAGSTGSEWQQTVNVVAHG